MPFQNVTLTPGVNTQGTFLEVGAGVAVSNMIRWKDRLPQKMGGWKLFYPSPVSTSPIRDVHAFSGLLGTGVMNIGAQDSLKVILSSAPISSGPQLLYDITPLFYTTS